MTDPKYISPQLGRRSITIIGMASVAAIALAASYWHDRGADDLDARWITGLGYGMAMAGCWLATAIDRRFIRLAARVLLVILFAVIQGRVNQISLPGNLANLAGLLACQSVLMTFLGIPNWELPGRPKTPGPRFQFGIGDLVISTTTIAILHGIALEYAPPVDPIGYWLVLVLLWTLLPLSLISAAFGLLNQGAVVRSLGWCTLSVGLLATIVACLCTAEFFLAGKENHDELRRIALLYGKILGSCLLTFAIVAIAGRLQRQADPSQPASDT